MKARSYLKVGLIAAAVYLGFRYVENHGGKL